jgi:hypothetical protein
MECADMQSGLYADALRPIMIGPLEGFLIFAVSTVVFDLIHLTLHRMQESRFSYIRNLGALHIQHHEFFDNRLVNHEALWRSNFIYHLLPEFAVQLAITSTFLFVLNPYPVLVAICLEVGFFLFVVYHRGKDPNHTSPDKASRPSMNLYVFPNYHAYHHRFPHAYFSSWFRFTDFVFGHSWHAEGQHVLLTGSNGALGKEMYKRFLKMGSTVDIAVYGKDYDRENNEAFRVKAQTADLLVLCHGSKNDMHWSHVTSQMELTEIFIRESRNPVPEIWGLGSEIEFHPALYEKDKNYELAKREFAGFASKLFRRNDILYRHLVPSAFQSTYGSAPISAKPLAWLAFFSIKRGFRYVPLTYTGVAWLNYFKFRWRAARSRTMS